MTFEDYIEQLATLHRSVLHSKKSCHFSRLVDDSQSKMASKMHYPCIVVDSGDMTFVGSAGNTQMKFEYTILFLQHVADTRSEADVINAFEKTQIIMTNFAARILRDKTRLGADKNYSCLRRIDLENGEGHRIYLRDAGLYGWALFFRRSDLFVTNKCDDVFTDNL